MPAQSRDDPHGEDECNFLITTSGPEQCETMYGIAANQIGCRHEVHATATMVPTSPASSWVIPPSQGGKSA